jgi:hypothetical protein
MSLDPNREAVRRDELRKWRISSLRVERLAEYYRSQGYEILCKSEEEIKSCFEIRENSKLADLVARHPAKHRLVIAEVKGVEVDKAVVQVRSTARHVRRFYAAGQHGSAGFPGIIECKIFTSLSTPQEDEYDIRGTQLKAKRVGGRCFPAEWLLYEYSLRHEKEDMVREGNTPIMLIFGPYI